VSIHPEITIAVNLLFCLAMYAIGNTLFEQIILFCTKGQKSLTMWYNITNQITSDKLKFFPF